MIQYAFHYSLSMPVHRRPKLSLWGVTIFLKKNLYANVQLCETRYRDIVTAVIYCYITTLRETWLWPFSMWRCYVTTVWIYKSLYGENVKKHFSRNLDIFAIKWLTSMACCLFYCPLAFQRDPKPLKRVIVFRVSSRQWFYRPWPYQSFQSWIQLWRTAVHYHFGLLKSRKLL